MSGEVVTVLRSFAILAAASFALAGATADTLYKSRDENGALVFSDLPPVAGQAYERQTLESSPTAAPVVTFRREATADGISLWADNPCYCPAEVIVQAVTTDGAPLQPDRSTRRVVPARSATQLLALTDRNAGSAGFRTAWVFGDPAAIHAPDRPYRPPFAAAKRFLISQAFPDARTHATPDSRYAVDIVMPEQTAVYAARGGTVVEVAHSNFRGGRDRAKFGAQANLVRILHADGTFALYAHLSWDSIHVHPGQRVERGELIAASGNTGFSTGPHLHFVVVRNAGLRVESVPVVFSGGVGEVVVPRTGGYLVNP